MAIALWVRATVSATANPPVTITTGGAYIRSTIFEIGLMPFPPTLPAASAPVTRVYELDPSVNW